MLTFEVISFNYLHHQAQSTHMRKNLSQKRLKSASYLQRGSLDADI